MRKPKAVSNFQTKYNVKVEFNPYNTSWKISKDGQQVAVIWGPWNSRAIVHYLKETSSWIFKDLQLVK